MKNTKQMEKTIKNNVWLSQKGILFVLSPKRGMCTDVNSDIAQTVTAKGQSNWTGSFISPEIDHLEKSKTIGGDAPVKIVLKNGKVLWCDGKSIYERKD